VRHVLLLLLWVLRLLLLLLQVPPRPQRQRCCQCCCCSCCRARQHQLRPLLLLLLPVLLLLLVVVVVWDIRQAWHVPHHPVFEQRAFQSIQKLLALLRCRTARPPCFQTPQQLDHPGVDQRRIAAAIAASCRHLASRRCRCCCCCHGLRLPRSAQQRGAAFAHVALCCCDQGWDEFQQGICCRATQQPLD
jgi:hypothetical protein